jgi:hypothetical protein
MLRIRKLLPLVALPLLLAGCAATLTNLTPLRQTRNPDGLYPVEVALASRQQTMRWESIQPYAVVGGEFYPMRPTPLMTNRWETLIPVPAGTNIVHYRFKFDYRYNAMGGPRTDSALSQEHTLRIVD